MPGWYRPLADGVALCVRLTPRGGQDRVEGLRVLSDDSRILTVRVSAAPEKGAANAALEKLIAKTLDVAPTTVTVVSGHKTRLKTVHVAGDPDALTPKLRALTGTDKGDHG